MSPSASNEKGSQNWLQELKTNRRTQWALVGMAATAGFMVYSLWPDPPKRPRTAAGILSTSVNSDTQLRLLDPLKNLASLDRAGELPNEARMYRDLLTFEGPPPPPPPPVPPPPPPPPPSPEEIAHQKLQADRAAEEASKPSNLKFLGYFHSEKAPRIAAFIKGGQEPYNLQLGAQFSPKWKLIEVTKDHVIFQNLKYTDMKHKVAATDADGASRAGLVTNEF